MIGLNNRSLPLYENLVMFTTFFYIINYIPKYEPTYFIVIPTPDESKQYSIIAAALEKSEWVWWLSGCRY